ncbi:glycosyltransferase [Paraclostridium bifermentans]|uniref:glycosyltransferase n=1 Tax=Paraclostridium bifermentans TaxID=1490 RepID=UPI00374ED6AC
MKKVLLVVRTLDSGGISRVVINLANKMVEKNIEVHIAVLSKCISYDVRDEIKLHILSSYTESNVSKVFRCIDKIIPVTSYMVTSYFYSYKFRKELDKIENKYGRFNSIFCHGFGAYIGLTKIEDKRFYFCSHSTNSRMIEMRCRRFKKIAKKSLKHLMSGKQIIAVSEGIKDDWIKEIKLENKFIKVIYNVLNKNEIERMSHEKLPDRVDHDYIICVGRFSKEKRHDILLNAYKIAGLDEKLILLGEGPLKNKIKKYINELGLQNKVIMEGFVDNPYKWIRKSKALVLSSDYEGLPTVLVESLICGTVPISTNCKSGPREILTGELSNLLCNVGDSEDLANKIRYALELNINLKKEYLDKFDDDLNSMKYISLIK